MWWYNKITPPNRKEYHMKRNKWQRNYENVVRAQNRAKTLIAELNAQGQSVSEYLVELVNRPLKTTRYTSTEARKYINLVRSDVIRASAKRQAKIEAKRRAKTPKSYYTAIPYQEHQAVKNRVRYQEKIAYNPATQHEDIARAYFEHMKYAISNPTSDLARNIWRTFKVLDIKGTNKLKLANMDKFLEGIKAEDFIKAYADIMKGTDSMKKDDIRALQNAFYGMGRSSIEAYNAAIEIQFEQSKLTFGRNHGWNREDVDKLYNFFKNSKSWRMFQKLFKDSDQFEELFDEISNTELSIQQIDRILMSNNNVDDVLREMRGK